MNEYQKRFVALLKTIFELDKSDLDFGIYRIINIRQREIVDYFENRLPKKIQEILAPFANEKTDEIKQKLAKIESDVESMGMTIDTLQDNTPKKQEYIALQKQLSQGSDMSALESDVYSALYSFFNRYYEEGDFISKRRYKEGVYAIPYEGEEVKLYWANQDQYYIKTAENFKDYSFVTKEGINVHFRLVDATIEQNNNKETNDSKRVFMLYTENDERPELKTFEWNAESKELIIRFIFDIPADKKKNYADDNYTKIREYIIGVPELMMPLMYQTSTDPKKPVTLIQKHLNGYVAKNTFDYFIHKDLGGFLTRELDFFIKNEVMHLDDLDTDDEVRAESYLAKVRAVKRIGKEIITFLAQIENFQRKLWLKKKFVVETNWCITLDHIDKSFYPEIIANKTQIQEWIDMYAIDEIKGDLNTTAFTNPPSIEFLKENQNLIVDTKNFPTTFRDRLIASIDNIDENTNGLMINGDNYHAINLLQEKCKKRISCIYGDPPYNAKSSEILYKNNFKHSSWIAMMNSRLELVSPLKTERGAIVTAIDENEGFNLMKLLDTLFPYWSKTAVSVLHNPAGVQGDNFSYSHEYAIFLFENFKHVIGKKEKEEKSTEPFRDWGPTGLRNPQGNTFYPIIVNCKSDKIVSIGDACAPDFHTTEQNVVIGDNILIYPVGDDGIEKKWVFARDSVDSIIDELYPVNNNGVIQIMRDKSKGSYKTVWDDKKYYANVYGSKLLNNIMGTKKFDFPKSLYTISDCILAVNEVQKGHSIIMDYFAGSGTTGHAVINLNRKDKGNRKYILIEMGEYFDSVTKPRMTKVIYSPDWKDGKPTIRNKGISQIMKYMRLESYEDALSNISLDEKGSFFGSNLGDEYLIGYMLDMESKGSLFNLEAFITPFEYNMKITEKNECKERQVDVVETFNYLIGLSVHSLSAISYFSTKEAVNPSYEGAVDLQKDQNGVYGFRQVEGTLPDGRRALVIWRNINKDNILASNAALDAYFSKYRINPADREFDVIYINGDNNLENLRLDDEQWKVMLTETEFNKRMWEE
ncbi:DNA methyltransferase [Bacteroides helcogenes]|uniref:Site-specific DNA-methyltransferase (Adenine-specific) n=1 Tax=Bacteroides helcogenes (strain ATCC 35417 / DSM 20613 / JCM 6297 / CCUG 15421 / P 36-108) TaxID=693979 RepID=E6SWH9_BACT6|nr:DNA methyltransferase [Bacteroides helcogenes]ADV44640.1 Site-specific DNA-methyltransferase (adenine-specific) [Bacteroides helcogenes P 36-108]MDY5238935.1 DNA methyltransferase [Bacteroides helcogenes]